jgi:hypothetical protein
MPPLEGPRRGACYAPRGDGRVLLRKRADQSDVLRKDAICLRGQGTSSSNGEIQDVPVKEYNCIVVTQSCNLENDKALLVALCSIYPISAYEAVNPSFKQKAMSRTTDTTF